MKKRLIFLAASLLMLHVALAQFNFNYNCDPYSPYEFDYFDLFFEDINGDHCADVLTFSQSGNTSIGYEINNNQLGSAFNISNNYDYFNISIVDMNNDGYNDIVAKRYSSSTR